MPSPPSLDRLRAVRARLLHLPPGVQAALDPWRTSGGRIAILGPLGSGRSQLLDALARELVDSGRTALRFCSLQSMAWSAAELALADDALPAPRASLPHHRDPLRRAQAVADLLVRRAGGALWVVVDDLDALDDDSAQVLAALARRESVHVAIAASDAPPWAERTILLPAWSVDDLRAVTTDVLGLSLQRTVLEELLDAGSGRPGPVLDLLERALAHGALSTETGGWSTTASSLSRLPPRQQAARSVPAQRVGEALAALRIPQRYDALSRLLNLSESDVLTGVSELSSQGLVRVERGRVSCWDAHAVAILAPAHADAPALHRTLALALAESACPRAWLVPHLLGAGLRSLGIRYAAHALDSLALRDPAAAADVAEDLWRLAQQPEVAAIAIRCLAEARRHGEALSISDRATADLASAEQDAVALARVYAEMARLHADQLGDLTAARACLRDARRGLAGQAPPLALLEVEATLHLKSDHFSQALATARMGTTAPLPTARADRRAWMGLRIVAARALAKGERLEAAVERLHDAPAGATEEEHEQMLVEAGALLWRAGQFLAAADAYAKAARVDRTTYGRAQVRWMDRAATARYHGGDRKAAVETWSRALALARRSQSPSDKARIQSTLCSVLREVCRFKEAARHGQEAFDTATACGATNHAINAAMAMGDLRMVTHEHDGAATWYGRCGRMVERHRLARARGRLARRWAELAVRRGDPRAREAVDTAIRTANRAELVRDACRAKALKAVLFAREGRIEQVEAVINHAMSPLVKRGAIRTLAEVRLWAAQAWLDAGDPKRAIEEAAHAVVWADEVGHLLFRNRADDLTARAQSANRESSLDAPSPDLERLLDMAVSLGQVRDLTELLGQVASAARHLVDADRAFVVLGDARQWRVAASSCADGHNYGEPSHSVVRRTLQNSAEVAIQNVEERNDFREQDSIVHLRLRSAWCFPLYEGDRTLGAIYADSQGVSEAELVSSQRLLRALASQASVAVTNARLLAESQQRAERAADIAHDMRSPLSSVAMAAEQLRGMEELPDWVRDVLGEMEQRVSGVLAMAERFLEDRPRKQQVFDLTARVARLTGFAARAHRHVRRTVSFESTGPAAVCADAEELDRAINNLLNNALQHTPDGTQVQVLVQTRGLEVDVIVRDQGPGIPKHLLPRLFERGKRGSSSRGYGLGLNIARRLAEAADGSLRAHNTERGGAQFTLTLPLANPRSDASQLDSLG